MNEIDIKHACSFTGHRPEKLEMAEDEVVAWLEKQIRKAVDLRMCLERYGKRLGAGVETKIHQPPHRLGQDSLCGQQARNASIY